MTPQDVNAFWIGPRPDDVAAVEQAAKRWYAADDDLDAAIRRRFGATVEQARAGRLADWETTAIGSLALVVLLDQFSRNAFRGTAAAFAGDEAARAIAVRAIAAGFDLAVGVPGRALLYHPFEHSEDAADQERSVALFEKLLAEAPAAWRGFAEPFVRYAEAHRRVIARFGRFPHRNALLGRPNTSAETAYLDAGGGF